MCIGRILLFLSVLWVVHAIPDAAQNHVVVIQLSPTAERDATAVAADHGFQYYGTIPGLPDYHVLHRDNSQRYFEHNLDENDHVLWWEEQVPQKRYTRINTKAVRKSVVDTRKDPKRIDVEKTRPKVGDDKTIEKEKVETRPTTNEYHRSYDDNNIQDEQVRVPFDPMVVNGDQWHLVNPRDLPGADSRAMFIGSPINVNVLQAWENGFAGQGIIVGVVDDGLQWRHPDVRENYVDATSWDVNNNNQDPTPSSRNSHGIAAAGLVAAATNSECGVGVAFHAGLSGIKLLEKSASDSQEAMALAYRCNCPVGTSGCQTNRVFTCSWGPADTGRHLDGPGHIAQEAMQHCYNNGNGGFGTVYVWAGGNGKSNLDNSNYDGYANSRYTIAVAAAEDYGDPAYYSEPGANILITAPSSGASTARRISTIDLMGRDGVTSSDCRTDFGGTSAAAPIVAGGIATILSANQLLSPRDIEHILVRSADRTKLRRNIYQWVPNAAGFYHSDNFGFGLLDVSTAVSLARQWATVKHLSHMSSDRLDMRAVHVRAGRMVEFHWNATISSQQFYLEHVQLTIEALTPNGHGWVGLQLCSPTGTCSLLQDANPGRETSIHWTYDTVKHWGEDIIDRTGHHTSSTNQARIPSFSKAIRAEDTATSAFVPINMWYLRVANMCNTRSDDVIINSWQLDFWGYIV